MAMDTRANLRRAKVAQVALRRYASTKEKPDLCIDSIRLDIPRVLVIDHLPDLICDLLHLARELGLDPEGAMMAAQHNYDEETALELVNR